MAKSSGQLVGVMVLSVLALAGTGLFGVWYSHEQSAKALKELGELTRLIDTARQAQVEFKIQVQLWKNVLLRGRKPEGFQSYWQRFRGQSDAVQKTLKEVQEALVLPEGLKEPVARILTDHAQLFSRYERAISEYVPDDRLSLFRVDEEVRGIDQALNTDIDGLATRLAAVESDTIDRQRQAGAALYRTLSAAVMVASAVAVLCAGLVVWQSLARRP